MNKEELTHGTVNIEDSLRYGIKHYTTCLPVRMWWPPLDSSNDVHTFSFSSAKSFLAATITRGMACIVAHALIAAAAGCIRS